MKKHLVLILGLLTVCAAASAVPAMPGKFKRTLPDGSVILLENHGDENAHWLTDENGNTVEKGPDGFYRIVPRRMGIHRQRGMGARPRRTWSDYSNPPETNFGDRKILCIIANFSDSTFISENPKAFFTNLLNQENYSENGGTGSVRDYYIANSQNQYRPQFDVYGPVTLSHSSAYYDGHEDSTGKSGSVAEAILEAATMLSDQINFPDYDTDGDGDIDMILFYYPGHNQAEGASEESIWPHQSSGNFGTLGGKTLSRYFCTSELRGASGNTFCGIGTTCHEFAHSLGLPDFYDTDYEENGGKNDTTRWYDLMTSGPYLNNGRTPPYMNAMERNMLGWMDYPEILSSTGTYTLEPIQNNKAYRSFSKVDGEYFIYECRVKSGWDAHLYGTGMLVYHVDKSQRLVGGYTAESLWETNSINCIGGHPCFTLVPAWSDPYYESDFIFPGYRNTRTLTLKDWDGNTTGLILSNITFSGSEVTFKATQEEGRWISGTVSDKNGLPLEGVQVVASIAAFPFTGAPSLLPTDVSSTTDATGHYEVKLTAAGSDFVLSARKQGYVSTAGHLTISGMYTTQDIALLRVGQDWDANLYRFDPSSDLWIGMKNHAGTLGAAFSYSEDELTAEGLVGGKLSMITFLGYASTYGKVYVFAFQNGQRILLKDVTAQYTRRAYTTVDLSEDNVVIGDTGDLKIGVGFTDLSGTENVYYIAMPQTGQTPDNYYTTDFLGQTATWKRVSYTNGQVWVMAASVEKTRPVTLAAAGYAAIAVRDGVPVAVAPAGKTVREIEWYLDGIKLSEAPAGLSSGVYMARFIYYDGTTERVYLEN